MGKQNNLAHKSPDRFTCSSRRWPLIYIFYNFVRLDLPYLCTMISYFVMLDDIWRRTALPNTIMTMIYVSCSKQVSRNFYIFMGPIRHNNPCCNLKYRHMNHVVTSAIFGPASLEQHHAGIENATVLSSEPVVNAIVIENFFPKCHYTETEMSFWRNCLHGLGPDSI